MPWLIWASARENLPSGGCEQHRHRPACASAQTDQPAPVFFAFWKASHPNLLKAKIQFSVAEQAGLKLALWETPKTGFLARRPISNLPLSTATETSFIGIFS